MDGNDRAPAPAAGNLNLGTGLVCPKCGVGAACQCGVAPITRAEYVLAQSPEKSNRAAAKAAGVSESTVRRARKAAAATASGDAVEKPRAGLDGKSRRMPKAKPKPSFPEGINEGDWRAAARVTVRIQELVEEDLIVEADPETVVRGTPTYGRADVRAQAVALQTWLTRLLAALDEPEPTGSRRLN